jgi:putative membrane protein
VTFLATQGDVWDAQKDMALCLVGAGFSLLTLAKLHDKALKKLDSYKATETTEKFKRQNARN